MIPTVLVRVIGSNLCAGMIYDPHNDMIITAAPRLHEMRGKSREAVRRIAERNGWRVTIVPKRQAEHDRNALLMAR